VKPGDHPDANGADGAPVRPIGDGTTPPPEAWVSPGVIGVAASSLFSDSGHELTTALLPSFLVSVLHASAGTLGVIEGSATDCSASPSSRPGRSPTIP